MMERNVRRKPSQSRSKATVEVIVEGAARVFVERGFDSATTNHIAKAAGVSVGSLYQYFPNKEALAAELIDRHLAELLRLLTEKLAEVATLPVVAALPAMVRAMFDAHSHEPQLHRVLMEAGSRVGMDRRKREVLRQFHALARLYLESHRDELKVRNLDLGAYLLVFAIENIMREIQAAPPPWPLDDVVAHVAAMCVAYLDSDVVG